MERLYLFFWRFFLPKEEIERRKKGLVTKKLTYFVEKTSPGGIPPMTTWEKLKFTGFIILFLIISVIMFIAIIFIPPSRLF